MWYLKPGTWFTVASKIRQKNNEMGDEWRPAPPLDLQNEQIHHKQTLTMWSVVNQDEKVCGHVHITSSKKAHNAAFYNQ